MALPDCIMNLIAAISYLAGSLLGRKRTYRLVRFRDGSGNFEMLYPKGWKYDYDIAIVDSKYTIAFESPDGQSKFVVAVDCDIRPTFDFIKYAKRELEGPESGIVCNAEKGRFRNMACYRREYTYSTCGQKYFGAGVMFYSGEVVFSLIWSGPEREKKELGILFTHMVESFAIREGSAVQKKKRMVHNKLMEIEAVSSIRET